jgi:hypothetical protein
MLQGDGYFRTALLQSASAGDISHRLRRMEVVHLLVRFDVLTMFGGDFDESARKRLAGFFQTEVDSVFESRGYGLFRLRGSSS